MIYINSEPFEDVNAIYAIRPNAAGWRKTPKGNFIKIGKRCVIGNYVRIGNGCEIGNEVRIGNECVIGHYGNIYNGCLIGNKVRLGKGCQIAAKVQISFGTKCPPHYRPLVLGGLKYVANQHPDGLFRLGCEIRPYDWFRSKTGGWARVQKQHEMSEAEYRLYLSFMDTCELRDKQQAQR